MIRCCSQLRYLVHSLQQKGIKCNLLEKKITRCEIAEEHVLRHSYSFESRILSKAFCVRRAAMRHDRVDANTSCYNAAKTKDVLIKSVT